MEINEFLEIVKVELSESQNSIDGNTKFRELEEWDSLTGMSIVVLLEEHYGVGIPDDVFRKFNTFYEIFNYIKENK